MNREMGRINLTRLKKLLFSMYWPPFLDFIANIAGAIGMPSAINREHVL